MMVEKKVEKKKIEKIVETEKKVKKDISKKEKTSDRSVLLRELRAKAKKFAAEIKGVETEDIKKELNKKREMLIPLEDYVKTGIHLGTKVITPGMKKFVYRRRSDSIGVLNTGLIDENLKKAIDFMVKFSPEEIALVCKRESGWESARFFHDATGIRIFTKKYPAGMMTNTELEDFYEPELVIVCDAWIDRNALGDAIKTNKKVIMISDTNNYVKQADVIVPANNKSNKALGLIFWVLAKNYLERRKIDSKNLKSMEVFTFDEELGV